MNSPFKLTHKLLVLKILNLRTTMTSECAEQLIRLKLTSFEVFDVLRRNLSNLEQPDLTFVVDQGTTLEMSCHFPMLGMSYAHIITLTSALVLSVTSMRNSA